MGRAILLTAILRSRPNPTYERSDYDSLFSGKFNLLTDLAAAARPDSLQLATISDADAVTGWFRLKRLARLTKPIAQAADGWYAGMVAEWTRKRS
jgi:hypothetical protein